MLSADGDNPVFFNIALAKKENAETSVMLGSEFTSYADELVSALTSAKLSENPDPYDLSDSDRILLQIEIMRNGSESQQGMDFCHMDFFKDGTLSVFGTEQFCGEGKSYTPSVDDMEKIIRTAERIVDQRTSCPPPMRITDPLSSFSASGAMAAPSGMSWDYVDPNDPYQHHAIISDSLHPLDAQASNVKVKLYSSSIMLDFPAGFEPDKIKIVGWDISKKGDTSEETLSRPKTEYENNFPGTGDYTGFFELESNTVYMVTVTYDSTKSAERGFYGSADYCFETGDLN